MRILAFPIVLLMLMVAGVVVTAILIAVRRNAGPAAGWVTGVLVVVLGVLAVPLLAYRFARSTVHVTVPNVTPAAQAGATWVDALAKEGANVTPHTSMRSAGHFLAERVADAVGKVGGGGEPVALDARDVDPDVAHPIRAKLPRRLDTAVERDTSPADGTATTPTASPAAETTRVVLSWDGRKSTKKATWWPTPMVTGRIRADVTGPGGSAVVIAEVAEKPWLRDHHSGYVVSAANGPNSSEDFARQHARRDAVARMVPAVRARLATMGHGADVSELAVRRHVEAAVMTRRNLLDEAVVRVDRPYGAVYYAAELHDAGPHAVEAIAGEVLGEARATRQSWAGMALALGGMLAVLGVLYLALNALTRGYFRAHLGAALAVTLVLGAVVIVLLLG